MSSPDSDDRMTLRRELIIAVAGILIGTLGTAFNKLIESELEYWRETKVIEYDEHCQPMPAAGSAEEAGACTFSLRAIGKEPVSDVRLSMIASPPVKLSTAGFESFPYFAPPDPPPIYESSDTNPGILAINLHNLREPQQVRWQVKITSPGSLTFSVNDLKRAVTSQDPKVLILERGHWRWKRWLRLGALSALIPLTIIALLSIVVVLVKPPKTRKETVYE